MKQHLVAWRRRVRLGAAMALLALSSLLLPSTAGAHCDSVEGPVVKAAQASLDAGDVTLVLPYVQAEAEAELTAAFEHTLEVRALGPEAQALADRYFFETAVRLHRTGEGAAYTGLVEGAAEEPALLAADAALAEGELDPVLAVLTATLEEGIAARYDLVREARAHAAQEGTVEADRQRVEAELGFEKYIFAIYTAAVDHAAHGEAEAAGAAAEGHHH